MMGDDAAIVEMARVCVTGCKTDSDDRTLIRYLLRHKHTTPFEGVQIKWRVKCPIFVARQWFRHRMASYNEMSQRYAEVPEEMHIPDTYRAQAKDNKQGSSGDMLEDEGQMSALSESFCVESHAHYIFMVREGVAREQARHVLPLGTYTQFIVSMNLWSLMHFLHLRCAPHAQEEIRIYAQEMQRIITPRLPLAMEAFVDYIQQAVTFSRPELEVLGQILADFGAWGSSYPAWDKLMSSRERKEFEAKLTALGIKVSS